MAPHHSDRLGHPGAIDPAFAAEIARRARAAVRVAEQLVAHPELAEAMLVGLRNAAVRAAWMAERAEASAEDHGHHVEFGGVDS